VILWVWGLLNAGLVGYGIHLRRRSGRMAATGFSVRGTIVDNKYNVTEAMRHYAVVRYKVGRRTYTTTAKVPARSKHVLGTEVEVRYDPADPAVADIDGTRRGKQFMIVGAASFALLGAMLLLHLTM
jgi:hypothetical protein